MINRKIFCKSGPCVCRHCPHNVRSRLYETVRPSVCLSVRLSVPSIHRSSLLLGACTAGRRYRSTVAGARQQRRRSTALSSKHLMPCTSCRYGKWVEDVCAGQFGVSVYLVQCCLVGCCTWFGCCAANQHKAAGRKTRLDIQNYGYHYYFCFYKIMVAAAIYSITMVLWKETAFPLCRAMHYQRRSPAVRQVRPWPDHVFCHKIFCSILCLLKP